MHFIWHKTLEAFNYFYHLFIGQVELKYDIFSISTNYYIFFVVVIFIQQTKTTFLTTFHFILMDGNVPQMKSYLYISEIESVNWNDSHFKIFELVPHLLSVCLHIVFAYLILRLFFPQFTHKLPVDYYRIKNRLEKWNWM